MNGTQIDIEVVCKIKSASKEFINSKEALGDNNKGFHSCFLAEVTWSKHEENWFKIICDVALDQKERMVGVGIVVKNERDWVATRYKNGMINLNWMKVLPSFLVHILDKDGLPTPC
ncbi:hypothetical protein J1N35_037220 [Gossypium stocksii]|uniref:Uncharacterized protein n=1 Tax=Gossypium stocksii TaxID=47602 RepID=A0A9D3UJS1_9ROSI|nr:hypothetical protein J1N35_037220 [Gossypium stocksii]